MFWGYAKPCPPMVVQLGQVIISLKMNFTLYVNQVIEMAKFNVNQMMIQNNCKCFFKNIEHFLRVIVVLLLLL